MLLRSLPALALLLALGGPARAQEPAAKAPAEFTRTEDVIYGSRDGHAMTMDVFAPSKNPNGAAVILCVSAGFESNKGMMGVAQVIVPTFTKRGYVVFAVLHSSAPKYSVPEIIDDIHRAVRFVKAGAAKYKVDPDRLGIAGASSGGCLSLMMGCGCRPGNPDAADAVERQSSKVAAVACFFPPTDFPWFEKNPPPKKFEKELDLDGLFPFREFDAKARKYVSIDEARRREIGHACSPLYCATKDAAPTFIVHGDKDDLVPLKQSEDLIAKLKTCGVACDLDVKEGWGHDPKLILFSVPKLADWFDKHLQKK